MIITFLLVVLFNTIYFAQAQPNINDLADRYNEDRLRLYPISATYEGENRYNDLLPNDITLSYIDTLESFYSKYLSLLSELDTFQLTYEDRITFDILKWECQINLEKLKYPLYLLPINQLTSLHLIIGQFAAGAGPQPFNTAEDYYNWLTRLNTFIVWCDTAIVNMKKGMELGYVIPKSLAKKVAKQFRDLEMGSVEEHLFFTPVKSIPDDISLKDKLQIDSAYRSFIRKKLIPTLKKMREFVEFEYIKQCRSSSGISDLPLGREYYNLLIKYYTTTDLTADEIYNLGVAEVNRILSEMEKVKNQVGFEGNLQEFFEFVRTNKKFMPFTVAEQVIKNFERIHKTIEPNIKKLFNKVPQSNFEVRRTEEFREATASAEYLPGSPDGTRPGIFYVPIPDVTQYNIFYDEDLFLHEAIPGHHFQISLQQENANLPNLRKTIWYNAYGEGWSLYCESLGKELGLYSDPYQYFGMLSLEIHRAIRLVVDVGIHVKGWTREEAIKYSMEREALPENAIESEIERYMADPAQALSYKIGQLKIKQLRLKAEKELGNTFSIKEFHDKILESGCLPIKILEAKIDDWLSNSKNSK